MRVSPRKCLAVVLVGALTVIVGCPIEEDDPLAALAADDAVRSISARPISAVLPLRILSKEQIAWEVAAGRRSLVEAAALFGALNRVVPAAPGLVTHDNYYSDLQVPVRTDEERLCQQVVDWVAGILQRERPGQTQGVVARLTAEFHWERRRHGAIRLPDPATVPGAAEILRLVQN
jgi:hypothetical protein